MNNPDFYKERSSLQLPGKGFMIVVVVIFSALSFTLGYFVGKYENPSQAADMALIPQKQETAALPQPQTVDVSENEDTLQAEETASGPAQEPQKELFVLDEAKKTEPLKASPPVKEKTAAQLVTQQSPKEPVKDTVKKPEAKDSSAAADGKKSDGPVYTVQMAAFKSASEAKSFSKKHAKKGLKTYITTSTGKKKVKIYKVKTGEFRDKKTAEVLSLKLNKTEKLKSFVTLKGE